MKLGIICNLENEHFPLDYRRKIVMLMKTGLSGTNPQLYDNLYSSNKFKEYTFSVFFKDALFKKEEILIKGKQLTINFSTGNAELAIGFFNAFISLKGKAIPIEKNSITIQSVSVVPQAENREEEIFVVIRSPIVCREHNRETQKDWFYTFQDEKFEEVLKKNLKYQLEAKFGSYVKEDIEELMFKEIALKKTVVTCYDRYIAATIGKFHMSGKLYLLNHLLENGLAGFTGIGFGHIEKM